MIPSPLASDKTLNTYTVLENFSGSLIAVGLGFGLIGVSERYVPAVDRPSSEV